MDLTNRSILLTGVGSGIGRALALELAQDSPRPAPVGRRREPLEEVPALVHKRARAAVAGVVADELNVVRGESRGQTLYLNRQDPAAVDRMLAEGKSELVKVVAGHSSL